MVAHFIAAFDEDTRKKRVCVFPFLPRINN